MSSHLCEYSMRFKNRAPFCVLHNDALLNFKKRLERKEQIEFQVFFTFLNTACDVLILYLKSMLAFLQILLEMSRYIFNQNITN